MKKWYKLDNAAKIFPSVSNERRSNLFRLSFTLKEEVDPIILQGALEATTKRFPTFNVKLKRGIFWYYFEENKEIPLVVKEDPFLLKPFSPRISKGFLFRVSYYHTRISLEVFHALCDGYGGLEFIKSLIYTYFNLKGSNIDSENMIVFDMEKVAEEIQDSFVKNYNEKVKTSRKESRARHFVGNLYDDNWISIISGYVSEEEIKDLCKQYDCSITQLICACLIKATYSARNILDKKKKNPFQIFVPVNLRRFFPSKTLRNFSLYVRTYIDLEKELSFEEIVKKVREDLQNELQKDKLYARIVANVKIERLFIMRIVPLFIKQIVLKIGYNLLGEASNSFSLSNLGKINLPTKMEELVDDVVFSNGAGYHAPLNMGVTLYKNRLCMTFTGKIIERDLQREFFRTLASLGAKVVIETNELEVV